MIVPKIPLGEWIERGTDWLDASFGPLFDGIKSVIGGLVGFFEWVLLSGPAWLWMVLFAALAWRLGRWKFVVFTLLGLGLILNLGYWDPTMKTLSMVVTAALISMLLGVPIGIFCSRSNAVQNIVTPILDFMQTMPAFVYLIPAVTFFSLGVVPGVISSVIFAIPPTIRLTNLGIRQVPGDLMEAASAFGSTSLQKLVKLQLPLALPTILAGINQTIMLSLSMVVFASMIGAQGVGAVVYKAVTQVKIGEGFEAGLAIVILAILLDRLTQNILKTKRKV
jgi:ABC-type proline/glycine betaine transport system permease subunit